MKVRVARSMKGWRTRRELQARRAAQAEFCLDEEHRLRKAAEELARQASGGADPTNAAIIEAYGNLAKDGFLQRAPK